jgi:hypothetical protein
MEEVSIPIHLTLEVSANLDEMRKKRIENE